MRKPDSGLLFVRIIKNRQKAEFALGITTTPKEFEDAMVLSSTSSKQRIASYIRGVVTRIESMRLDMAQFGIHAGMSVKQLRDKIKAVILFEEDAGFDESKLFMPFFKRCIEAKKDGGYKESREYTYRKIFEYDPNADKLMFDDIDLKWLNHFDEWMQSRDLKQNSRNIHFKNIRTVINRAIDEELTDKYPFRRFKIRPEATRKRNLPVEELRKLFTCEVEDYQVMFRDLFKLMFMLCGINAVDLFNLKDITYDKRIEYKRAKTHRLYSIKVEPEAMEIIERYRGEKNLLCLADRWKNHKDFTKWMNHALKRIGEMKRVGRGGKKEIKSFWPDITGYWSRHSWATIAYNDLDIPKDTIAQGLGHGKNDVTDIYLDKEIKKVDVANRKILDWVLYEKR
ncbi:MAG: site-specific integrase [Candidatus Amulumruptor caecigallinarius]|nr:site-specific integrase [Candidatus Amulumruptor caecigallinarius]